jgi:hypothetical protein
MKKTITLVAAGLTLAFATSAHAWGPREQGALAGIAGTLIFQHITQPHVQAAPVQPAPVYVEPPRYVYPAPHVQRPMFKHVDVYIPECNCYRTIYVQVN